MPNTLIILLGLALLFVAMLVVAAIVLPVDNVTLTDADRTAESGITYTYFTLDGMPCVYVTSGNGAYRTGGPSCDWSKYRGEK